MYTDKMQTWVYHSGDEMKINEIDKFARFFQTVKAFHFQNLASHLVRCLISPLVDLWQVDVIDKDGQLFASRRAIRVAHSLIHRGFDGTLRTFAKNSIDLQSTLVGFNSDGAIAK